MAMAEWEINFFFQDIFSIVKWMYTKIEWKMLFDMYLYSGIGNCIILLKWC